MDGVYAALDDVVRSVTTKYFIPNYLVDWGKILAEPVIGSAIEHIQPAVWIADVPQPILILHGSNDHLVPVASSSTLFARARAGKRLHIYSGTHDSPGNLEMQEQVVTFFNQQLGSGSEAR